jgi:hypothetical protein
MVRRRADEPRQHLVDLLRGRPGWRLEPRTTPGATPLWCFVDSGRIVYSVTADGDVIHLYVMESDQEVTFRNADGLKAWLQEHRPESMQNAADRPDGKKRGKKFFEWG